MWVLESLRVTRSRAHALSFDSDNYDRFSDNKRSSNGFGQPAIIFCSGWPRFDRLTHLYCCDNAQLRHAVRLSSSWVVQAQPRPNLSFHINACISTQRELFTDIRSFRDSVRCCLNHAPTTIQQREWFSLTKDFAGGDIPEYAILSHTWEADSEEATFEDLMDGTWRNKAGYDKIRFCGE
jgi:hypothetical protein